MFAIVYKDKVPMCARLKESGPDAVVTWDAAEMAKALGIKEEEIELVPFPS